MSKKYPHLEEGDILEIVLEEYGHIKPYVVRKIDTRTQGEYGPNNSMYIGLRLLCDDDMTTKGNRDRKIVWKLKK